MEFCYSSKKWTKVNPNLQSLRMPVFGDRVFEKVIKVK
jgi:hypothetical protein